MKFRKKPVVIEAVQWFPGVAVEGVEECKPELIFSSDGKSYYLSFSHDRIRPKCWLPVADVGEAMPFAFWSVKSGERRVADPSDPLVVKYMDDCGLEELPSSYGLIRTLESNTFTVSRGDWIITGIKGERYACKPDIFEATYEPAEPLADVDGMV